MSSFLFRCNEHPGSWDKNWRCASCSFFAKNIHNIIMIKIIDVGQLILWEPQKLVVLVVSWYLLWFLRAVLLFNDWKILWNPPGSIQKSDFICIHPQLRIFITDFFLTFLVTYFENISSNYFYSTINTLLRKSSTLLFSDSLCVCFVQHSWGKLSKT